MIIAIVVIIVIALSGVYYYTIATAPPATPESVNFLFDQSPDATDAPIIMGLNNGIFQQHGLAVTINFDGGSASGLRLLASGKADMGVMDFGTMTDLVGLSNISGVKAVARFLSSSENSIIYIKGKGINSPKDLEGHKLGASTSSGSFTLLPLFAAANNINMSKVTVVPLGATLLVPALLNGQVDAILTFEDHLSEINLSLTPKAQTASAFAYANYGVPAIGFTIVATQSFITSHPSTVSKFVQAFADSLKAALQDPSAAGKAFVSYSPCGACAQFNQTVAIGQWTVTQQFVGNNTAAIQASSTPWKEISFDKNLVQATVSTISTGFKVSIPDPTVLYTNQFTSG